MTTYELGPWVGLRPFERDDEARFFGRGIETRAVAELWQEHRLTLLIGDSGVGKTSFLRAGVAPFLANDGVRVVPVGDLRYRRTLPAPVITAARAVGSSVSRCHNRASPTCRLSLTELSESGRLSVMIRKAPSA